VVPHHDQQASENGDPAKHGKELLLHTTLLLYLGLQIMVTFSTPTGQVARNPHQFVTPEYSTSKQPHLLANKRRILRYTPVVGGERASSVRQRYAGKICCECKAPLPPPYRRGERLCQRCAGASMKRVFLQFSFRQGWVCEFMEEDQKTRLPRTVILADERKLFELVKRGGFTLNISGRQEIEEAIRKKRGGVWLELTAEQYAKLRQRS
jgi:hypothetical protein